MRQARRQRSPTESAAAAAAAVAMLPARAARAAAVAAAFSAISTVGAAVLAAAAAALRGLGLSRVCFRCGQPGHFLSKRRAVPPTMNTRLPNPYAGAQATRCSSSGVYTDLGAHLLHHHSHPPCRRNFMGRLFRPSCAGALPPTEPRLRNLCHQERSVYEVYVWYKT